MTRINNTLDSIALFDIANLIDRDKSLMAQVSQCFDRDRAEVQKYGKNTGMVSPETISNIAAIVKSGVIYIGDKDYNVFEDPQEISYLDGLNRWYFRNSEGSMRVMFWLISLAVSIQPPRSLDYNDSNYPRSDIKFDPMDALSSLFNESAGYIVNLMSDALVPLAMQGKLPIHKAADTYAYLTEISSAMKQMAASKEVQQEIASFVELVNLGQSIHIQFEGPGSHEGAIKRLIQTVQAISSYRGGHNVGNLRSFLNGASSLFMFSEMRSPVFLANTADAQLFITNAEKQAQCHSYAAYVLLQRASAGQVVYGEMLNVCAQWHSLINLEVAHVFAAVARCLKMIATNVDKDNPEEYASIMARISALFTRCNILQTYVLKKTC